jgi:CDP-diacylglycerol---serine O-phosphatidyltransferase
MTKRVALLPNIITAFGLACGLLIIFKTNVVEAGESLPDFLRVSAILLVVAAIADVLDGLVARAAKAESEFGMLFDSLSDAITFGVAPAVLMIKSLSFGSKGTPLGFFVTLAAMLYSICGVFRLVRFNTKKSQAKSKADKKKQFTGLPIPAGAACAVSINFFLLSDLAGQLFPMTVALRAKILIPAMVIIGYLMISRWKFPSLKALQFRVPSFYLVFWTVLAAVIIIYGVLYNFALLFFAVSWAYLVIGWLLSFVRLILGKKSKSLQGFYPDPDMFK